MKKLTLIIITLVLIWLPAQIKANEAAGSAVLKNEVLGLQKTDVRVLQLEGFLAQFHSPLGPYAACFVENANRYEIDWKLVPAIAGVESTFGKNIPANSYNAYGWNNGAFWFESWEKGIATVTQALAEKYIARGLNTPFKIGPVYAPPSKTWAGKVAYFMNQIENFGSATPLSLTL